MFVVHYGEKYPRTMFFTMFVVHRGEKYLIAPCFSPCLWCTVEKSILAPCLQCTAVGKSSSSDHFEGG